MKMRMDKSIQHFLNALNSNLARQWNIQPQELIGPHPALLDELRKLYCVQAGGHT